MRSSLLAIAVAASLSAPAARAQNAPVYVTEAQARAALTTAAAAANGSQNAFASSFQQQIRKIAPAYKNDPAIISQGPEVVIAVVGPVQEMFLRGDQAVRRRESVEAIHWLPGVGVTVQPYQIDSPDIDKVVVKRDGVEIAPIRNDLAEREMATRMGAKRSIHAGVVIFPREAFNPGAKVVVILIPREGHNIGRDLTTAELKALQ